MNIVICFIAKVLILSLNALDGDAGKLLTTVENTRITSTWPVRLRHAIFKEKSAKCKNDNFEKFYRLTDFI